MAQQPVELFQNWHADTASFEPDAGASIARKVAMIRQDLATFAVQRHADFRGGVLPASGYDDWFA